MPKKEFGEPGHYLHRLVVRRTLNWAVIPLLIAACLIVIAFVDLPLWASLCVLVFAVASPSLLRRWERAAEASVGSYVKGRDGERELASVLRSALGDEHYLLHDLVLERGNIDHVVIAPSGIYTIETKADLAKVETAGDRLSVNGFNREEDLRQAFAEAMAVRDYLDRVSGGRKHFVTPLLVFTKANVFAYGKCRGVYVMHLSRLPEYLKYDREKLDRLQRAAIANSLGQRTTA